MPHRPQGHMGAGGHGACWGPDPTPTGQAWVTRAVPRCPGPPRGPVEVTAGGRGAASGPLASWPLGGERGGIGRRGWAATRLRRVGVARGGVGEWGTMLSD